MTDATPAHAQPLLIKRLTPEEVRRHLSRDPRLIVPVGTTEQHGPHLPLGCDTIIVERLADDLSAEFQVLRAPTIEYGVNAPTVSHFPEAGGAEEFIILTAHGQDPHQEALSTIQTREARIRTVDIFSVPLPFESRDRPVVHGGELDTSLLLFVDESLVRMDMAKDFQANRGAVRRYHRGARGGIPKDSPGSVGRPSRATFGTGEELYRYIYHRIASRIFRNSGTE
jgi:creatinine amidohydrolase/Fe(II)-dependent formamide hydrolase-like protein